MKTTKFRKWFFITLLALTACAVLAKRFQQGSPISDFFPQANSQSDMTKDKRDKRGDLGDVNVRLNTADGLGVYAGSPLIGNQPEIENLSRIIAIDGTPIKGLPLNAVRALLRGPINSKVKLEIINMWGQSVTQIVERQSIPDKNPDTHPERNLKQASDVLDNYDDDDLPNPYLSLINSCELVNVEPYATALCDTAVTLSKNWPDDKSMMAINTLTQAAEYYDKVGRIHQADSALRRAIGAFKIMHSVGFDGLQSLLSFADYLQKTDRNADAEEIYKALLNCTRDANAPHADKHYNVLRAYARLLIKEGHDADAQLVFGEMLQSPQSQWDPDVQLVADYYAAHGQQEKAIEIYTKRVEAGGGSEVQRKYDRDRPLVNELYKLACIQENASLFDQAIASLERGLDLYAKRLDEAKQIETEKLPQFFPTVSDVEIKLAEIYIKKRNFGKASSLLLRAVDRIEKALGSESPYLKNPLLQLAQCYEAEGNGDKARQLLTRAEKLNPVAKENADNQDAVNYEIIASALKSIETKDYLSADAQIQRLLFAYEAQNDSDSRTRLNLWCSLTYLGSVYVDHSRFADANKLFEQLLVAGKKHNEYKVALLPVLTERAVFAKQMNLPSKESWSELEDTLCFNEPARPVSTDGISRTANPANSLPDLPASEKLRRWALAYSYSGQYKRADAILQRARSIDASDVQEGQRDAKEAAPLMQAELALVEVHLSDFDGAKKHIENILSSKRSVGIQTAIKLAQIAGAYEQANRIADAQSLLTSAYDKGVYPHGYYSGQGPPLPGLYQWKLASILEKQHKKAEAEELISKALTQYKTVVTMPLALHCLAAKIAFARGDFDESASQYIAAQSYLSNPAGSDPGMRALRQYLLEQALAASEKSHNLPTADKLFILKELAQLLADKNRGEAIKLLNRALSILPTGSKEGSQLAWSLSQLYDTSEAGKKEMLLAQKHAVELAQSADGARAYRLWFNLAYNEANAQNDADAIEHIEHALALYRKTDQMENPFRTMLDSRPKSAIDRLRTNQHAADAERLLKEMVEATKAHYGNDSSEEAICLAELANFYQMEKKYPEMSSTVDRILHIYSEHDAQIPPDSMLGRYDAIQRLYEIATQLSEQGESQKAIDLVSQILTIQKQKLQPDNAQVTDTLFCLGALYKKAHKFDQAERCYRDAIDIEKQHSGNSRTVTFRTGEYVEILRKLGRNKEADQLTTLQPDESTHGHKLSNIGQLQSEATKCEREGNVEKARELFEQAHEVAKLEAPYGTSSISTLNDLAQFFVRQKKYRQAEQIYKQQLEIFNRDAYSTPRDKTNCLLALASVCVQLGQIGDARNWLAKAKQSDGELRAGHLPSHWFAYVELEVDTGLKEEAEKDLDNAERSFTEESARYPGGQRASFQWISMLWKKLGRDDKAQAVLNKGEALSGKLGEKANVPAPLHTVPPLPQASYTLPTQASQFGPYMADVQRRIKRAWFPPKGHEYDRVVVMFQIHKGGELSNLLLEKPFGLAAADNAALKAVENAAPFRPLPVGAKDAEQFEFTFDYNTFANRGDGAVRRWERNTEAASLQAPAVNKNAQTAKKENGLSEIEQEISRAKEKPGNGNSNLSNALLKKLSFQIDHGLFDDLPKTVNDLIAIAPSLNDTDRAHQISRMLYLAKTLSQQGKLDVAKILYLPAIKTAYTLKGAQNQIQVIDELLSLSQIFERVGKRDEAFSVFNPAIALAKKAGRSDGYIRHVKEQHAEFLRIESKKELFRRLLALSKKPEAEDTAVDIMQIAQLIDIYLSNGNASKARKLVPRYCRDIQRFIRFNMSYEVQSECTTLVTRLANLGYYAEAQEITKVCFAVLSENPIANDSATRNFIGAFQKQRGGCNRITELWISAIENRFATSVLLSGTYIERAQQLITQKQFDQAWIFIDKAATILSQNATKTDAPDYLVMFGTLGLSFEHATRPGDAEKIYTTVVQLENVAALAHPDLVKSNNKLLLAQLYSRGGKSAQAAQLMKEIADASVKKLAPCKRDLVPDIQQAISLTATKNRCYGAESLLTAIDNSARFKDHPEADSSIEVALSNTYESLGDWSKAIYWRQRWVAIASTNVKTQGFQNLSSALQSLAWTLEKSGRTDDAAKAKKEAAEAEQKWKNNVH